MSLIPCRSCERPLSKDAKNCPNCGAKRPTKHKKPTDYRRLGKLLLILLAVYVVAIILSKALDLKSNTSSSNSSDQEAQRQERDRIINIEVESEMTLRKFLKDSDSAEIRNQNEYCGEVNSKNAFGGYTGFKRYIASPTLVAIEGENMSSSEFQSAWNKVCP
ncbi:hypothetical protein [Acinetobacter higginsii]|jgi:hypothetical protein|uniref:hypothetical protein n=1 Tax=Acinetobacter higginsii TaxID=70347 RepID=UPI003008AE6A